ncbi:MAG: alpha/beta fold hydrolase [Pseudomonadota bacterium]
MQNKPSQRAGSDRRQFITTASGAVAGTALLSAGLGSLAAQTRRPRDIVLVHGAWHGGWCWDPVRALLEAAGHRVLTPTLTGLGSRANELTADVGLETHIEDVMLSVLLEDLEDFVLVGHSYGGMVITGVADRLKGRIAHIVYLDAALPKDGETMLSYGEPRPQAVIDGAIAAMRALAPDGVALATFPPAMLGVPEDHPLHDWVARQLTPHPLKTWLDPIALTNGGPRGLPATYVHCTAPALAQTQFGWVYRQLQEDPAWRTLALETGHDAMVSDPEGVARIVRAAAGAKLADQGEAR